MVHEGMQITKDIAARYALHRYMSRDIHRYKLLMSKTRFLGLEYIRMF